MSLMSKLLISTVVATLTLSASSKYESKDLVTYIKKSVVKNPQVKFKGIQILETKTHKDLKGWDILLTTMTLEFNKKEIEVPETIFIKDGLVTDNLVNQKTGMRYRNEIKPTVPESFYNEAHRLYGDVDAKHKMLIFSDPQCPFCQDTIPTILKAVKDSPKKVAVYYYHLPLLRIHPVSGVLTKIMHIAQAKGDTDVIIKMYDLKINPKETNVDTILAEVKKQIGYEVAKDELTTAALKYSMQADAKSANRLMVGGTPTIYIDGKIDKSRTGYKDLISFF